MRVLKVKVISLPYILYALCFTRPRYQVSVYRTIGPLQDHWSSDYYYVRWKSGVTFVRRCFRDV